MSLKFLVFLIFFVSCCLAQKPGMVIFLNGCSSAGKSSIARELKLVDPKYEIVSIDDASVGALRDFLRKYDPGAEKDLFSAINGKIFILSFFSFLNDKKRNKRLEQRIANPKELERAKAAALRIKKVFKKHLINAFLYLWDNTKKRLIEDTKRLALSGKTVILDHIALERNHIRKLIDELGDIPVAFIGIQAPMSVINKREYNRGDRDIGTGRLVFKLVHAHGSYDAIVDTSSLSPREGALRIQDYIKYIYNPKDSVFHNGLRKRLDKLSVRSSYAWYSFRTYVRMGSKIILRKMQIS